VVDVNVKKQQITLKKNNGKTVQWDHQELNYNREEYVEVYEPGMRTVAVGEQIRWPRNDKNLGVCNGDTGTVIKVGKKTLTVMLNNGQTLEWNIQEFHRQHWKYNYARTVHDVQGKTSSRVLALLHSYSPLSNLKLFYTAISRALDDVQLIIDDAKELANAIIHQTGEKSRALLDSELKWHVEMVKRYTQDTEKPTTEKS
jgi:ATP-dependent exoDNAse (exonuclease V) alpha subunit